MTTAWSQHGFTLAWRSTDPTRSALCLGSILVGSVTTATRKLWHAWISRGDIGETLGWFATEQEARDALVGAVLEAMRDE